MQVDFSLWAPFLSGNHLHKPAGRGRKVLTPAARDQYALFATVAARAVANSGWTIPQYVKMKLVGYNVDADGDNLEKPFCDGVQGVVIDRDRWIVDRHVLTMRDKHGSRLVATFEEVDGRLYGYGKRKQRKP